MKQILTLLLFFSLSSFAKAEHRMDTISNWQVYNGGQLLKAFNSLSTSSKIILTKGKIKAIDTVEINYFDDNPCYKCNSRIIIKSKNDKIIRELDNAISNRVFKIKTTDLQVMALKNNSSILKFYYRKHESFEEFLLFEIEIK